MEKQNLVDDLRKRQIQAAYVETAIIESLTDNEIIDAYITCSHCQKKNYQGNINKLIQNSTSTEEFLKAAFADHSHNKVVITEKVEIGSFEEKPGLANRTSIFAPKKRPVKKL